MRHNPSRLLTLGLALLLATLGFLPSLRAAYMTTVTASPGKIMDGERLMAEVPQGTKVWVFNTKPGWVEVKDPKSEQHGWMSVNSVQKLNLSDAQWKQLDAAEAKYRSALKAWNADQKETARRDMEESYQIVLKLWGKDHPHTADTAWRLSRLLDSSQDARVRQLLLEALEATERWLGRDHELALDIMAELASLDMAQAKYSDAKKWLALTINRCIEAKGKNNPTLAGYMIRLGYLYWTEGDIANARAILNEALGIYQRHNEGSSHNAALIEDYLGSIASRQGDQEAALRHHEKALEINRNLYGNNSARVAETLIGLGVVAGEKRDFATAKKFYDEALAIHTRVSGTASVEAAGVKHNLGLLAAYQRDFATARKYYDEVLPIYRRSYGNDHPTVAVMLNCLANVVRDEGDHAAARKMYEEAVAIDQKAYGRQHHEVGGTLRNLAFLAFQEGNDRRALRDWHESRQLENRRVRIALPALSPSEQMHYLNSAYRRDWFHALSFGYLRRTNKEIVERSAEWLLNGKAIAQECLAEQQKSIRSSGDENRQKIGRQLQDVRARLAALANSRPQGIEAIDAQLAESHRLAAEERRLAGYLAGPLRKENDDVTWYELSSLRAMLPQNAVYIDLVRMPLSDLAGLKCDFAVRPAGPANYFAWIIPAKGQGEIQILDLGPADKIDDTVEQVRTTIAASSHVIRQQGEAAAATILNRQLQQTADLVLRPLLPALQGREQLILSPDGALWLLPWAALPVGEEQSLLERCSIRYALSGRDAAKEPPLSVFATAAPAIFANPDFDLESNVAQTTIQQQNPNAKFEEFALRGFVTHSGLPRVGPLPFTEFEGLAARDLLKQLPYTKQPVMYQQAEALEEFVKTLKRPKHLLFATHGFFLPDPLTIDDYIKQAKPEAFGNAALFIDNSPTPAAVQENPLLRCGLLLSGCNSQRSGGLEDGILTGLEIVGLDLRGTELVVLSACETGIGSIRSGEGVAGLRQAFQLAGAQSVVSTLWQVPDRDSAIIMQDFLTNLAAKQNKAAALRNAQLKRIAARKEKTGAAHPFFWAAWTVTGDPPSGFIDTP